MRATGRCHAVVSVLAGCIALAGCRAPMRERATDSVTNAAREPQPVGDEIVVCGARIAIGAPVVLWTSFPGYDAYRTLPAPTASTTSATSTTFGTTSTDDARRERALLSTDASRAALAMMAPRGVLRYQPGRSRKNEDGTRTVLVEPGSTDRAALANVVDQFVLHYDACGTSRGCFRVLQDERGLSVHFLLDIDGTIYQTLDLREQAFHATKANARSIGIEIANVGAFSTRAVSERNALDDWYRRDVAGPYIAIPDRLGDGGVRTPGFVGRPTRNERVVGVVQGQELEQYDFTPEQYRSLTKLAAALCRTFPKIRADAPRDASGSVATAALSSEEYERFAGILGHYHVQTNKQDPGPAFDWERFLADVREEIAVHVENTEVVP